MTDTPPIPEEEREEEKNPQETPVDAKTADSALQGTGAAIGAVIAAGIGSYTQQQTKEQDRNYRQAVIKEARNLYTAAVAANGGKHPVNLETFLQSPGFHEHLRAQGVSAGLDETEGDRLYKHFEQQNAAYEKSLIDNDPWLKEKQKDLLKRGIANPRKHEEFQQELAARKEAYAVLAEHQALYENVPLHQIKEGGYVAPEAVQVAIGATPETKPMVRTVLQLFVPQEDVSQPKTPPQLPKHLLPDTQQRIAHQVISSGANAATISSHEAVQLAIYTQLQNQPKQTIGKLKVNNDSLQKAHDVASVTNEVLRKYPPGQLEEGQDPFALMFNESVTPKEVERVESTTPKSTNIIDRMQRAAGRISSATDKGKATGTAASQQPSVAAKYVAEISKRPYGAVSQPGALISPFIQSPTAQFIGNTLGGAARFVGGMALKGISIAANWALGAATGGISLGIRAALGLVSTATGINIEKGVAAASFAIILGVFGVILLISGIIPFGDIIGGFNPTQQQAMLALRPETGNVTPVEEDRIPPIIEGLGCFKAGNNVTQSEWNRIESHISYLIEAHPWYVEELCKAGTILVNREKIYPGDRTDTPLKDRTYGSQAGNTITLYDSVMADSDDALWFTLIHESGHIYDTYHAPEPNSFATNVMCQIGGNQIGCEPALPTYRWHVKNEDGEIIRYKTHEDFAESIAWYAKGLRYPSIEPYNTFAQDFPLHYEYIRVNIFKE